MTRDMAEGPLDRATLDEVMEGRNQVKMGHCGAGVIGIARRRFVCFHPITPESGFARGDVKHITDKVDMPDCANQATKLASVCTLD